MGFSPLLEVTIKNTQRIHPIDIDKIKVQVISIQKYLKINDYSVDLWYCSNGKMRELNKEWRNKSKSTDVLSFPVNDVSMLLKPLYFNVIL